MRKRRTRKHQIEDLSYTFVERIVLEAFCTMRRYVERDYSYDATIRSFNSHGEPENGEFCVQVKATDKLRYSEKRKGFILRLEKRDLELWLDEVFPVQVVLYDANNQKGYFVELHDYFSKHQLLLKNIHKSKSVYIPIENRFLPKTIKKYQSVKNRINERIKSL